jgi:hypothetical protein
MSMSGLENPSDAPGITVGSPSGAVSIKKSSLSFEQKKERWWEWHKANPHVWQLFERFAYEAVNKGRKRISHWLIINRIRWETNIVTTGEDFKISNDHIAFYARLWRAKHPAHKDLFTIKRMIGESYE